MENIDLLWVLLSAFLVFLMQLGFSLIETGTVRSKNTINVAMKNLIDTIFGIIFFWLIGFGLMFGTDIGGLIGINNFAIDGKDLNQNAFFFFQAMFAATAVTIISGAVAERIKFDGYIIVAIVVTAVIYPIFGHWAWGEHGWLKEIGFVDFAGSTVVHSIGAWIGLAGAVIIGPRLGKFKHGKVNYFAPSNHNFIVFGVFILFFAWFGFNAGSLLQFDPLATLILINTTISAVFGGFGGWLISLFNKKRVGAEIFSFGIIAGLVGITAGCDQMNTYQAAFVGFVAALIMYISDKILLEKFQIDDPLSAVAIHGFAGAWGTLAVGIFAPLQNNISRFEFIFIQLTGIVVAFIFATALGIILFLTLHKLQFLRVRKKHEVLGLNVSEHNAKLPWVETIESIVKIMKTGNIKSKIHEERGTEVGLVARFFNLLLDILRQKQIELKKVNLTLKNKSEIDPLTKVMNRRALMDKIKNINHKKYPYCVSIIDIDKFKSINDTFGHGVGDTTLQKLSEVVNKNIRDEDLFARWGGEEFVLIMFSENLEVAQNVAEKLRIAIENELFPVVEHITVSIGVSEFKNETDTFDTVLEKADKALYQAKESGRNRVFTW